MLEQARQFVRQSHAEFDEKLAQSSAIEVAVAESLRPYRILLQFANPYAYQGAQLIGEYDTLVRTLLTGCYVGLLERSSSERIVQLGGHRIRRAFAVPQGYRFLDIDRASISRQDEKARQAQRLMGELPVEVLTSERQAPLVPRKPSFPDGYHKAIELEPRSSQRRIPTVSESDMVDPDDRVSGTDSMHGKG